MIRTIAIFALFLACAQARNVTFEDCSKNGVIYNTNVEPCPSEPCTYRNGDKITMSGNFKTDIASSKPTLRTEVKVDGQWVQYPEVDTDGCKYTKCPIEAGVVKSFYLGTTVINWPESVATETRFRLFNDDNTTELICGTNTVVVLVDE